MSDDDTDDGEARYRTKVAVAHEVLGRILAGAPIGEMDLLNVARFAHAFRARVRAAGYGLDDAATAAALAADPEPSLLARTGPAAWVWEPRRKP
jgi:hypothetical protein